MHHQRTTTLELKLAIDAILSKDVLHKLTGHEREIIKVISIELDEVKKKYAEATKEHEVVQSQLNNLLAVQDNASLHLVRANEVNDKLRRDNAVKTDQLKKLQKNANHMEDRIKQLELRASEVDQAEIALETTKRSLENCQQQLAEHERRFRAQTEELRETCKKLAKAQENIEMFEVKVTDLKQQVIQELQRNEKMEKEIEDVPMMKDELETSRKQQSDIMAVLNTKTALLSVARNTIRELKETLKNLENNNRETIELRGELKMSKQEIDTLKQLMMAKDVMVLHKTQALDFVTDVINTIKYRRKDTGDDKLNQLLDRCTVLLADVADSRPPSFTTESVNSSLHTIEGAYCDGINDSKPSISSSTPQKTQKLDKHNEEILQELYLKTDTGNKTYNCLNSMYQNHVKRNNHPSSKLDFKPRMKLRPTLQNHMEENKSKRIKSAPNKSKEMEYVARFNHWPEKKRSKSVVESRIISLDSKFGAQLCEADDTDVFSLVKKLVAERVDATKLTQNTLRSSSTVYHHLLRVGDRVQVKVTPSADLAKSKATELINHRYGTPEDGSRRKYCRGVVKHLGGGDVDHNNADIFIGVRLDNLDENSIVKDDSHYDLLGQLFPITDVTALFDVKTSRYIPMNKLYKQLRCLIDLDHAANHEPTQHTP